MATPPPPPPTPTTTLQLTLTLTLVLTPTLTRAGCPPSPVCLSCPVGAGGEVEKAICKVCPQAIPPSVKDVTVLGGCPIMAARGLLAPFFSRLVNVEKMVLSNCGISKAEGPVFASNTRLASLTLIGNNFTTFTLDVFTGLGHLTTLIMGRDGIRTLPDRGFSLLGSLDTLDLRMNGISALGDNTFQGLSSLTTLDASANPLTQLSPRTFRHLSTTLQTLTLKTTSLTTLPDHLLAGMAALRTVTFQGGQLWTVGVSAFAGTALQALDLSLNQLSAVPSASLRACRSPPQTLDLCGNRIAGLRAGDFARMDVHTLNLSSNPLAAVQSGAFSGARIQSLDLHNTSLSSLPLSMEQFLSSSRPSLDLSLNPGWRCDCDSLWLGRYLCSSAASKPPTCRDPARLAGKTLTEATPDLEVQCRTTTTSTTTPTTTTTTAIAIPTRPVTIRLPAIPASPPSGAGVGTDLPSRAQQLSSRETFTAGTTTPRATAQLKTTTTTTTNAVHNHVHIRVEEAGIDFNTVLIAAAALGGLLLVVGCVALLCCCCCNGGGGSSSSSSSASGSRESEGPRHRRHRRVLPKDPTVRVVYGRYGWGEWEEGDGSPPPLYLYHHY